MKVAQIGNFEPDHSTENELRKAIESLGHEVTQVQEQFTHLWDALPGDHDLILWTRTAALTPSVDVQERMLAEALRSGVPTVAYHLDRWWGLAREGSVTREPFFRCEHVFTADGGHDTEFAAAGVNHHWLPPAVSHLECEPGTPRDEYRAEVAFVGSWQPGYHPEWTHRPALVSHLEGRGCRFWPDRGRPAVRGPALRDLYASVDVVVGDSCLAGDATRYWSDRIPETLGRGGFLLHPYVEGIEDHFTDGKHLRLWPLGDWAELDRLIDYYLAHDTERREIAAQGRQHVLDHHTYSTRIGQVLDIVQC